AAEAWADLAREYESAEAQQGAWHLAIFNARIAGNLPKAAEYASEGASLCRDNTLKFQLFLSAHIDRPPSPDEVQSEFSDVNDAGVRSADFRWSAALIATDWTVAAEALESLAESSADLGVRDRSLYRAAFIRLNKGVGSDVAEQSLGVIRTRHEEFCDLLQKSPSISKVSRGRAPVLRQEDSDLSVEIRRADVLVGEGDSQAAANLLEQLAQQYPNDALVKYEFERACWLAKASAQLSAALMGQLRVAEKASDMPAKAALCEKLARVDFELRDDAESAMMFWETAANADPLNLGYQRTLEREYLGAVGKEPQWAKMQQILGRIAEQTPDGNEKSYYYGQQALLAQVSGQGEAAIPALRSALAANPVYRPALFSLESSLRRAPATTELAEVESSVASYFKKDSLARAAFLVRSGKTWLELDDPAHALRKFQGAVSSAAGFRPAFHAWREMALDRELWGDLAAVFAAESQATSGEQKIHLCHLVGVVFMDKDDNPDEAKSAFRRVLTLAPQHRDAFVRLRLLLTEDEEFAELAALAVSRIESISAGMASARVAEKCELHHLVATLNATKLADDETALAHFRAILEHRPNDREAVSGVADLTLKLELWSDAASALMLRVRMETDSDELKTMYHQLGTIYSEHLPEVKWALRSYERVIAIDPGDSVALRAISKLGMESGDYQIALGACEKLIAQNPDRAEKIATLHRIARIFVDGFQNVTQAERALRAALDVDPSSEIARSTIVSFFMGRNDPRSARIHIDTVVRAMHNRLAKTHKDAEAYRTLVHSLEARAKCGSTESESVAISAARVSVLLGESDSEIVRIAQRPALPAARALASGAHDDMLWAGSRKASLRSIFRLVGDRLSKTVGIDLKSLGVGRSDRLRKGGDLSVAVVTELCETMGAEVPDLYVARDRGTTLGMVPGRPAALVLGKELISIKRPDELRFLVGRSMVLARAGLAAPLGLGKADFGALLVALLRYFVSDFSPEGIDEKRAVDFHHRLRKLMSPAVMLELQPYAMGLTGSDFNLNSIWQETHEVANRAGLLCTGNIGAAVEVLMRTNKQDTVEDAMQDPEISSLVRFSISLDYGAYWAAISATES
ncbi:MAG: hypothetical protein JKY56_00055, partial [Kofleriaceae bacterium]|nr:hypothetical protein [Kofleriaceae bacterium]